MGDPREFVYLAGLLAGTACGVAAMFLGSWVSFEFGWPYAVLVGLPLFVLGALVFFVGTQVIFRRVALGGSGG